MSRATGFTIDACQRFAIKGGFYAKYRDRARLFTVVPAFCKRNGVKDMLRVYGVGDHGGGPTSRDIEHLKDMMEWPVFPTIKFSSYHKFFDTVSAFKNTLPEVCGELNFVFTGCYSTQSRIKAANRLAESALYEAEALAALSPAAHTADTALYEEAWRNVLFCQFNDILTGSGVADTREYALGILQEALAAANTQKGIVCRAISEMADTSAIGEGCDKELRMRMRSIWLFRPR